MEVAQDPEMEAHSEGHREPRRLGPAEEKGGPHVGGERRGAGPGGGHDDAGRLVDALKASAESELTIAERLSTKARHGFALAAGVFVVAQTVAFGGFEVSNLSEPEKSWMLGLAIGAVAMLAVAALATIKADATYDSRDLPLGKLEDDLNAAYEGDRDVTGRLGGYYLGVVRTRRESNKSRRRWYKRARVFVALSLVATVSELIVSLVARID